MTSRQRITLELRREQESKDRWPVPLYNWPGFQISEITDLSGNRITDFTERNGVVVYRPPRAIERLFAAVDLEPPSADIESAKLEFERSKAATEDRWRVRTYLFSIGSAVLTALVTLGVAFMARPSHASPTLNVDALHACRDSVQRLSTLTQLNGQTLQGLSNAVNNHVTTCDPVLEGLIESAAKADAK